MEIIRFKKLDPRARVPTKATEGSACFDIYCLEDTYIGRWGTELVRTGLAVEVPRGFFIDIRPRSGLSFAGFTVQNAPGILDSDYRGELRIMIRNWNEVGSFMKAGDRIAQIRLVEVLDIEFEEASELSETGRGEGGFGSTGR